jgi:hypothetical protein
MSDTPLHELLGNNDDRDPGCDAGMEVIDEYCEAVHFGRPIPEHLAPFIAHIRNCVTCREDTDALLAALRGERLD